MATPVEYTSERVQLGRLPSGMAIETTVHQYVGSDDGPTVYVQAAQHGREMTGIEVIRQLHERLSDAHISGRVVSVPLANPLTFDRLTKTTPEEFDSANPNMNRAWPGDFGGSLHERMCAHLWEYAKEADVVIDLHSISADQLPHVRYTENEPTRQLARTFGTEMLVGHGLDVESREAFDEGRYRGTLREAAHLNGSTALTPELGHSRHLSQDVVARGVSGILDVLRFLDVLAESPTRTDDPIPVQTHLAAEVTDESGLFVPNPSLELGASVDAGQRLGMVADPTTFECRQQIEALEDGFVWYIGRVAAVVEGDGVVGVAVPEAADR